MVGCLEIGQTYQPQPQTTPQRSGRKWKKRKKKSKPKPPAITSKGANPNHNQQKEREIFLGLTEKAISKLTEMQRRYIETCSQMVDQILKTGGHLK